MNSSSAAGSRSGIRPGTANDVRALIRMHEQCSQRTVTRRYLSPLPVLGSRLATRLLLPRDGFSLVDERDGELVAVTTVAPYCDPRPRLTSTRSAGGPVANRADVGLLVADEFQGQGIGTALLLAAAREAARRDFAELVLTVHPDNPAVLPMVHATGLRARIGTRDGLTQIAITLRGVRRPTPPCTRIGRVLKMS
jgi:GNAT superfamily N-acetyltransferase